jgi:hypothetical protein
MTETTGSEASAKQIAPSRRATSIRAHAALSNCTTGERVEGLETGEIAPGARIINRYIASQYDLQFFAHDNEFDSALAVMS